MKEKHPEWAKQQLKSENLFILFHSASTPTPVGGDNLHILFSQQEEPIMSPLQKINC